jgi:hypothetical protein
MIDRPPTPSAFGLAVWLATQKVAKGDFTPEERSQLDMTVLRKWRANPARAADEMAELIAGMPEGMRLTLTEAATKAGRRKLGYVVEHGEELVADRARAVAWDLAAGARARVPQEPAYDEDKMLPRLIREALFHRDSERRHLACLLISASPFGIAVTDEMLGVLGGDGFPSWVRVRAATTVRYLSADTHRMRMMSLLEDPDPDVVIPIAQGLGHLTFNMFSDQAIRASLTEEWSPAERAKLYALGMTGSPGLDALLKSSKAPAWQKSGARWWKAQGPAVRS